MARLAVLFALCLLPAIAVAARPTRAPLAVMGRVYCDTCQAGFETPASTYIAGAKVKVECKDRTSMKLLYSQEAFTDSTGTYKMFVSEDHQGQLCDAMLLSSPQPNCMKPAAGRDRARVILTRYNGIASDDRYVNNMGFVMDQPMAGCAKVLQQYQDFDE
ncbi:pollen-specific protein C13 [Rhodamnia argentea]|uniref:Pollen-specific protein C13 n=1 Tax=Rhodamnia argentea TaxID=178133 RepID=A0A8B8Q593_9MYRT|nr:pollen-specific protein C13 [Rhodamnia argentea]